jgi:hypothetical protein
MEGKMKKIFVMFAIGLPFMAETMQSRSIVEESFVYHSSYWGPDGGIACHPPTTRDQYGRAYRRFAQHASPKSSVIINEVVLPVTSIENIAYDMRPTFPINLYDEKTGHFTDDIGINTAAEDNTLQSIRIPASIQLLDVYCFYQCRALEEVEFEQNSQLQRIRKGAFLGCVSLKSITIPKSVQFLDKSCFFMCEKLTNIIFESCSNLEQIEESAFGWCSSLKSITVSASMNITPLQNYFGANLDKLIHVVND